MSRNNKLVVLSRRVGLVARVRTVILMGWTKASQPAAEIVWSRKKCFYHLLHFTSSVLFTSVCLNFACIIVLDSLWSVYIISHAYAFIVRLCLAFHYTSLFNNAGPCWLRHGSRSGKIVHGFILVPASLSDPLQ